MIQIRLHGRGGQGVVTAAELIAIASFFEGKETQAFPSFGVERTGAPIEAFARISDEPIRTREHIYEPDILIVQDATLLNTVDISHGAKKNTKLIINTSQPKEKLSLKIPLENIYAVDATKIAMEELGRNIVNTVILGAFAKVTGLVSLDSLKKAIQQKFEEKGQALVDKNIKAIERAFTTIKN